MNFDLRGRIRLDPAESQQAEGLDGATLSVDAWQDVNENCTFAAGADTMGDYGYGDPLEPEAWREIANPGWHGGEGWDATMEVIRARPDLYPDPPAMTVEYPGDVVAAMRDYGAQGFMVHWAGWCTPDARWITTRPAAGISHAGRIVYADDGGMACWNVWTGYLVYQPDSFWRASYDGGGLLVFHRSLTGGLLMALTDAQQAEMYQRLANLAVELGVGTAGAPLPSGTTEGVTPGGVADLLLTRTKAQGEQLKALQDQVATVSAPTVDAGEVAAHLASDPDFVAALGQAIVVAGLAKLKG